MFSFDHLAVACEDLTEGSAVVEEKLGVSLGPVGHHPHFGTHNRLLSLGGCEYLEVIAIDPAADVLPYPRWFDLDRFSGLPTLTNWILNCPDLDAALACVGNGAGEPVSLARGDYRWRMAVPPDGVLPFENRHPALIEWQGPHPAPKLPDSGCRLRELVVVHPEAGKLQELLQIADDRVRFEAGTSALQASIETPHGLRDLR